MFTHLWRVYSGLSMANIRKILHLDLDAFFCAVEELRRPELRGKAFAVGGRPDQRGVVASCSYAARQFGIHSAMPMARALRLCPDLIIVSGKYSSYSVASRQVMKRLRALTPLVEQISIDEAFLDVTDLPEDGETLARRLQAEVRTDLSLPCSLGVASNKLVAKIASDVGKFRARQAGKTGPPNAITVVPPGQEAAFLAPLPVEMLWGVGPKTAARLAEMQVHTIGQLSQLTPEVLSSLFGKNGADLARRSLGQDDRPVVTEHETKSLSQETTFARDVSDRQVLLDTIQQQSEQVARRVRKHGVQFTTVKIKLRWPDFTTITRQTTLSQPTDDGSWIYRLAEGLLLKEWRPGKSVRLVGVGVSGLVEGPRQLGLWDVETQKERALDETVQALRNRYGEDVIARGRGDHRE
jgi:DNA polymerase-4